MLTNIKLSKTQLSKITQSGKFFGNMTSNLDKKSANRLRLATKGTSSILDEF